MNLFKAQVSRPAYEESCAEGVGFEPTRTFALPVFKTGAINRSTTPPDLSAAAHSDIRLRLSKSAPELRHGTLSSVRSGYLRFRKRQTRIAQARPRSAAKTTSERKWAF